MRKRNIYRKYKTTFRMILLALIVVGLMPVFVSAQAIKFDFRITEKTVLSAIQPFVLKPVDDVSTKAKVLEGSCILEIACIENLQILATLSPVMLKRDEFDDSVLFPSTLAFRNDGSVQYPGEYSGNSVVFPLNEKGRIHRRAKEAPPVFKAYLFVLVQTGLSLRAGSTVEGDINLNIEYN